MERSSISNYGLTVVSILVIFILMTAVAPIGKLSKQAVDANVVNALDDVNKFESESSTTEKHVFTITVTYQYADETRATTPYVVQIEEGQKYYIESPDIEGYTPDLNVFTGTATSDLSFTVTYALTPEITIQP